MMYWLMMLVLLAPLVSSANNCTNADQIECDTSLCSNYYYLNNSCQLNVSSNCTTSEVNSGGACVACSGLNSTSCQTTCMDWVWSNSSCQSCGTFYSVNCIRCNTSVCLDCAVSSNTVLAHNGLSCVANNCSVANCVECYENGTKCFKCSSGYVTDSNSTCAQATCSITNCNACDGSLCLTCFSGYALSTDRMSCNPVCSDLTCLSCTSPGVCGSCQSPFAPDASGKCVINCGSIQVANCASCSSDSLCTVCSTNYTAIGGGSYCQPTCTVSNCQICMTNSSVCESCASGYDLVNNTCTSSLCSIQYCAACSTSLECGTCAAGFTLASTNVTCVSDCLSTLSNCLLCSNSTTCTVCESNYILTNGSCVLPCTSVTNCVACLTTNICRACGTGFTVSTNGNTCDVVCQVSGCASCPSSTSTTCTTCASGYTSYVDGVNTKCARNCGDGEVDTGSNGTVSCTSCDASITNCLTCSVHTNSTVVYCDACLDGYFINGQICDLCSGALTDCLSCSDPFTCTGCASGFFLVAGACYNVSCAGGVTNCHICDPTNTSLCVECDPGFTLSNGTCSALVCADTFVFDETTNTCTCPLGTYSTGSACVACADSNCLSCTASACSSCSNNYYPSGTSCQPCMDNCQVCLSASSCSECDEDYSPDASGACVSLGGGADSTVNANGVFLKCPAGCRVCTVSQGNANLAICTKARKGYSIVGGNIRKCDTLCKTCQGSSTTVCSSCYTGYALVSGTCQSCTDPNAKTCSSRNLAYSLTCKRGYVSGYFANVTAGVCSACAQYCKKCTSSGPGNCDANSCDSGSVQLTGTTNCTLCFSGCVSCSASDLNQCNSCGKRRYLDATSGACTLCPTGCKTCTDATTCQSCTRGYFLVGSSCVLMPNNCVNVDAQGVCTACFGGYGLTSGTCTDSLACNSGASCTICPDGYYLSNGTCQTCALGANCLNCDSTNNSTCVACNTGYYLDGAGVCQTCMANCLACDSSSFCTLAASGYHVVYDDSGAVSGAIAQCQAPCSTCFYFGDFCLSCNSGFTLEGSVCTQNVNLLMVLLFGPGTGNNPIFVASDSLQTQLFKGIKAVNFLGDMLNNIAPSAFKSDGFGVGNWRKRFHMKKFAAASLQTTIQANGGTYTSGTAATSAMTNALASTPTSGLLFMSSTISSTGFNSTAEEGDNLGLILGLAIPLGILLILLVVMMVRTQCMEDQDEYKESPADSQKEIKYGQEQQL